MHLIQTIDARATFVPLSCTHCHMLPCLLVGLQGAARSERRNRVLQRSGDVVEAEVKPSLTAGTPSSTSRLECTEHSAVNSHVTLDAMAIRERWPDGIPEKMMKMWGLAAATHNNSRVKPGPGEPPHIFQNPMNHHHVLISGGRVYLSQETARFASLHLPALLDILEASPTCPISRAPHQNSTTLLPRQLHTKVTDSSFVLCIPGGFIRGRCRIHPQLRRRPRLQ